ncbi:hypothetical protein [Methylobacterium sp. ap11]|uniref:hypothetical protein n=1 Tax=Methylobacterium sp. ap11 TaxID=1761799 RepID=UPI001160C792|nr:hypothetical protein [Methylobacterium sp. ap11]
MQHDPIEALAPASAKLMQIVVARMSRLCSEPGDPNREDSMPGFTSADTAPTVTPDFGRKLSSASPLSP